MQLFEMGLELSLARLKALAKFALGIGLAQVSLAGFFSGRVFVALHNAMSTSRTMLKLCLRVDWFSCLTDFFTEYSYH